MVEDETLSFELSDSKATEELAAELDISLYTPQQRRDLLLRAKPPLIDQTARSHIDSLSTKQLEFDNFQAYVLLQRLLRVRTLEELMEIIEPLRRVTKNRRINLPDNELSFRGIHTLRETRRKIPMHIISDIANSAIHTTSEANALADVHAEAFRPASAFDESGRRNSITHALSSITDPVRRRHYERYLESGHIEYVFFTSTSLASLMTQVETYAHGHPPVVFWTRKYRLSQSGVDQEADQTLMRFYGEVKLKGAVPVSVTEVIFVDTKRTGNETIMQLQEIAPVVDISVLAVIDLVAGLIALQPADPMLFNIALLPRGNFKYMMTTSTTDYSPINMRAALGDIYRRAFELS